MKFVLDVVLKNLISRRNLSARKVAKATGVPLSTLTGYMKPNRSQVDPEHLIVLSKYFQVSVDYLLTGNSGNVKLDGLPGKTIFSRVVRLTIEDIDPGETT